MTATSAEIAVQIPRFGRYDIYPQGSTVAFTGRHLFGLARVQGTIALRRDRRHRPGRPLQRARGAGRHQLPYRQPPPRPRRALGPVPGHRPVPHGDVPVNPAGGCW
jgi:hypothetical protein